jgi:APA family basic amino acid/polyamine antiporter
LFAFLVVSIAVPVLRSRRPDMRRPFKAPFNPVLPVVSAVCCILLMSNLAVETWLRFLVWLVVGLLIYLTYSRTHARLADPARFDALVADEQEVSETPRD